MRVVAPPTVKYTLDAPSIRYRSLSYSQLQSKRSTGSTLDKMKAAVTPGAKIVLQGLTETRQTVITEIRPQMVRHGRGWCVTPQVNIRLANRDIVINMPNWYEQHSCEYRAVHQHEQEHARIFLTQSKTILASETQRLQLEMAQFYGWTPTKEEATQWAQGLVDAITSRMSNRLKEIDTYQDRFDSPYEYDRMKAMCASWR